MIRLKNKQILVEPIYDSDYYNPTSKLIKIPDSAKERCDQGIVKYMGADCDPAITIGSHVIFSGYTGTTIGIDDELLILMHSDFVKAILDVVNYEVPGLYLKDRYGYTFPASYETATRLLRDAASKYQLKIKPDEHPQQRDPFDERNR